VGKKEGGEGRCGEAGTGGERHTRLCRCLDALSLTGESLLSLSEGLSKLHETVQSLQRDH
jgi:hypothetical protein